MKKRIFSKEERKEVLFLYAPDWLNLESCVVENL